MRTKTKLSIYPIHFKSTSYEKTCVNTSKKYDIILLYVKLSEFRKCFRKCMPPRKSRGMLLENNFQQKSFQNYSNLVSPKQYHVYAVWREELSAIVHHFRTSAVIRLCVSLGLAEIIESNHHVMLRHHCHQPSQ